MPSNEPVMCPSCRANPELVKICTICGGKAEVIIKPTASGYDIYPIGDFQPSYSGTGPVPSNARKRLSVADGWNEYERLILDPLNAGQTQRSESRRVWYAAISWMLTTMAHGLDEGSDASDMDEQYMASVHKELSVFGEKIKQGLA